MKKKICQVVLVVVVILVGAWGIARLINCAYFSGYKNNLDPNTAFSASDSIGFYGSLLTFIGTVTLGALALYQTKEANSLSKRLMSFEEAKYKLEVRPFFILSGWRVDRKRLEDIIQETDLLSVDVSSNFSEPQFCLTFNLTNTTSSFISIKYSSVKFVDETITCTWQHGYANTFDMKVRLSAGETKAIRFYGIESIFKDTFDKGTMAFEFVLENRFGEKYTEIFDANIIMMAPPTTGGLPYIVVEAFNYRIGKNSLKDGKLHIEWETVLPETLSVQQE